MKWLSIVVLAGLMAQAQDPRALAERAWRERRYDDANAAFRAAVQERPKDAALRVRWGRLLLERFNAGDATGLFQEALEIEKEYPPALLGLALVAAENFDQRAMQYAQRALEKDPELVEARELLANVLLEDGSTVAARAEALKIRKSKNAVAVLAAIELLADRDASQLLGEMGAHGEGYARIARHFVLNRRYEEAIDYYRKAVEADPGLYRARTELGVNLMRVGKDDEARRILEAVYNEGNSSQATRNSLRLLDTYKDFVTVEHPRYVLRLHKGEVGLLRLYFERQMERALAEYDRKYGVKLAGPVTVEVYPNHEDFAVRTMGMPGLGALGVTFGLSVAMDSPSARKPGSFHWASTLWHELSHVYVIAATRHRVPRWFTEGLSVHEETQADAEWGDRLTPEILSAMKQKQLLGIAQLDRGFIRPSYPSQVIVSYFQAGRVCDYIQSRWGWPKLMEMMRAFAKVTTTAEVIEGALGMKAEEFDAQFLKWLEEQHARPLAAFEEWSKAMKPMNAAVKEKKWEDVERMASKLTEQYPEYVEAGSAYEAQAEARLARGDKPGARAALARYAEMGGRDPELLKKLAGLEKEMGQAAAAAGTLERLLWIYPVRDEGLHRELAGLRGELGQWAGAVEEWRSVVESKPIDKASAYYGLAAACRKAGLVEDARDALLAALEEAPGYRAAQKLLLELNETANQEKK